VHVNGWNSADIAWGIKEVLCDSNRAKKNGEKTVENECYNTLRGGRLWNKLCKYTRCFNIRKSKGMQSSRFNGKIDKNIKSGIVKFF